MLTKPKEMESVFLKPDRTGRSDRLDREPDENRFGLHAGSAMLSNRCEPVRTGQNRLKPGEPAV
jgi:hypothetical protein